MGKRIQIHQHARQVRQLANSAQVRSRPLQVWFLHAVVQLLHAYLRNEQSCGSVLHRRDEIHRPGMRGRQG